MGTSPSSYVQVPPPPRRKRVLYKVSLFHFRMLQLCYVTNGILLSCRYMGITGVSSLSNKRDCIKVFQPTSPYYKLCTGTFSQLGSIMEGTTMALKECEKQFHWRRWNCNILNQTKSQRSSIGNTLRGKKDYNHVL